MEEKKKTDFRAAAEIITRHFHNNGHEFVTVTEGDIDWQQWVDAWESISPLDPSNSYWSTFFNHLSEDRSKKRILLNHYKSLTIGKSILQQGNFHASHLPSQSANDAEEYYHYMRQVGHPLATGSPLPKKVQEYYPDGVMTIEQMRDDVYVWCLTDDESNDFFWDEYASHGTGIRFRLKYSPVGKNQTDETAPFPLFHLRKMFYDLDSNDRMAFLDVMNSEVKREIGYELMFMNVYLFATFYKRKRFDIEKETRLSFDLAYLGARNSYPYSINIRNHDRRKYIEIPISNRKKMILADFPFSFELLEVVCGKNMSDGDYKEICKIVEEKYHNVDVSKMS